MPNLDRSGAQLIEPAGFDNASLENAKFTVSNGVVTVNVSLNTLIAGEDLTNDVLKTEQRSSYINLAASGAVKTASGRLFGIFVASASSTPTIKLWDNSAGSGSILVNTFTPVGGTYYPFPGVEFGNGLYVTISGTVDCTVFYK